MVVKSVDDIFKNTGRVESQVDSLKPPKDLILSELLDHQKYGLGWLVGRENSVDLPPFWEEEKDGEYVNVLTNHRSSSRPAPFNGGIFADDAGLGKTLTLLSLIAYHKILYGNGDKIDRRSIDDSCKRQRCLDGSKTTLVVCPPSVVSTWLTQLQEHTKPDSLNVYTYYGSGKTKDVEELKKYDIVLTTYSTLARMYSETVIQKMEWWRIILDEGHIIQEPLAGQSRTAFGLKSEIRWLVTGTPIQKSSSELYSLVKFLRLDPLSNFGYWNSLIQRPLARNDDKGLKRLEVLMTSILLRRTKDQNRITLPSKTIQICHVDLSAEERELYDQTELEAKNLVREYINVGSVMGNYSTILSILIMLRQICTDASLLRSSDFKSFLSKLEDVSKHPELLLKTVELLAEGEDSICPICISPPINAVMTRCKHLFCGKCIMTALKRTNSNCPNCRQSLSESDLFSAPPRIFSSSGTPSSSQLLSSKVSFLLKLLSESKKNQQDGVIKSVVFSQFQNMLLLLEEPLKAAGIKTVLYDVTMNAKKRAQAMQEFCGCEPNSPTVLLTSLRACTTGINLTAASEVYLLEPWWNVVAEERAMERVYRIGQKRDVKIVKIIARGTIEERVLQLLEKNRKLARGAIGRKDTRKRINVKDLSTLMSL